MKSVVVHGLSPDQKESWEFHFEVLTEGGGIVSVPTLKQGYPIDWPPRVTSQAVWLRAFAPKMKACAAAAWSLKLRDWERLLKALEEQVALEQSTADTL